jgi:hypothetical protein
MGTRIGGSGLRTLAWCAGITLVGYLWSRKLYNRDPEAAASGRWRSAARVAARSWSVVGSA